MRSRFLAGFAASALTAGGLSAGVLTGGPAAAADTPPGSLPTYTFVDLGTSFLPQAVSTSGVLTGYVATSSSFALETWYGGKTTPLQLPTPPAGGTWRLSGSGYLNPSLLAVTSLLERTPDPASGQSITVPVAWQIASDGVPSAPRIIEQPAGFTPSDSRGVVGLNYAGNVLIFSSANGGENTQVTAPNAGAVTDVPSAGRPYTISASTITADTVAGTPRYQAIALKDFSQRSTPGVVPVGTSDNGYLVGDVPNTFGEALIAPDGTLTVLPPGTFTRVDDNGDVSGDALVVPHGASAATSIDSLIPASAGATPGYSTITAMDDAFDLVGVYSVLEGSTYVQHGFLLRAARSVTEPVVNSTGDARVTQDGKLGCDTGQTVTVGGKNVAECTLRAAIQAENAGTVDAKTITFALPSATAIAPATPLPALTAAGVTVDASTGPGATVTIDGSSLGSGSADLELSGGSETVQGFVLEHAAVGVLVDAKAGADVVRANSIGVVPNSTSPEGIGVGVKVDGAPNAMVGGATTADRNVIANVDVGVLVTGAAAHGARVQGNYLGADAAGDDVHDEAGVAVLDASGAQIGGPAPTPGDPPGNVVGGSSSGTVTVSGSAGIGVAGVSATVSGTVIQGNLVGVDPGGVDAAPGRSPWDVLVGGRVSGTQIGGVTVGAGNVLSNAAESEVTVSGTSVTGTSVLGNLLGTDASGLHVLGGQEGVEVDAASATTIGSPGAGRNVMAGGLYGVKTSATSSPVTIGTLLGGTGAPAPGTNHVTTTTAMSTVIAGNIIGPLADGTTIDADHVQTDGVALAGLGETLGPNNQLAFTRTAVNVAGTSETVTGNLIGTDPTGTSALPNGTGVFVASAVGSTLINGVPTVRIGVPGQKPNVISGNTDDLFMTSPALVQNNRIGPAADGLVPLGAYTGTVPEEIAHGAGYAGVLAFVSGAGANGTQIGGTQPGFGNVISGGPPATASVQDTGGLGITATHVSVQGNDIGVGADGTTALPNAGYGIRVGAPGADVVLGAPLPGGKGTTTASGGNVVANNAGGGIVVEAKVGGVSMLSNSIHDNTPSGISLDAGANNGIDSPTITSVAQAAVTGPDDPGRTVAFGTAFPKSTVQVYAAAQCATDGQSAAQGATAVLATVTADDHGAWTAALDLQPVGTAIDATDSIGTSAFATNTSSFSTCVPVQAAAQGSAGGGDTGRNDSGTGTGFNAGEPVSGSIHSTPITLGTKQADANGTVAFAFTVPASLAAGTHYLLLQGSTHAVAIGFTVRTVSTAPRSLKAVAGKAVVALSWSAPAASGGAAVTAYRVYRSGDRKHWTWRATVHTRIYHDTNVVGGTRYYYEVRAVNAVGASPAGNVVNAIPYTAPSAPRSVHAKAGTRAISLTWQTPAAAHGSAVSSYVVEYATCRIGTHGCYAHAVTVKARSRTITGLVGGRSYHLEVIAVNRAGRGPASTQVTATPKR